MIQGCHKKAKTEDRHDEELKEIPNINIHGDAEEERVECRRQDNQAAAEAGRQEERRPDGAGSYHAVEHAEIENVSEPDTQDNVHGLAWYQDMIRAAVADVAVACQKIRELDGCRTCPICVDDAAGWKKCTFTDCSPDHHQYMLEARRSDKTLDKLFMEQEW